MYSIEALCTGARPNAQAIESAGGDFVIASGKYSGGRGQREKYKQLMEKEAAGVPLGERLEMLIRGDLKPKGD